MASGRRSHVVTLVAGIVIGGLLVAPAAAGIRNETTQLWNKLKPLADKRYYTKKASNARYYTKAEVDAKISSVTQIYAYVDPNPPSPPTLVPEVTHGFTAVSNPSTGVYCLTPEDPSIDPLTRPLIVTAEFENSAGSGLEASAAYDNCPTGQFGVVTQQSGSDSNDVAFFVFVP